MSATSKPLVCLVDDDSDLRNAVRQALKAEGLALVTHSGADEFLDSLEGEQKPIGCLLIAVGAAAKGGLDLLRTLHESKLAIPVIFVAGHTDVATAVQAIKLGALDVLVKPLKDAALVAAVREALAVHERWREKLQERQIAAQRIATLTPREVQVLDLMVTGLPNRQIAEELGISPKTLDIHRSNVMDKMQARTTADLVRGRMLEQIDPRGLPYLFG